MKTTYQKIEQILTVVFVVFFSSLCFATSITYDTTLVRQNDNDQTVYWTLTDDTDQSYEWHGDIPKGVDIQKHLERNVDRYLILIRKREYPSCAAKGVIIIEENQTELEVITEWISDGCVIPAILDDEGNEIAPEKVAEKVPWKATHPTPDPLLLRIQQLEIKIINLKTTLGINDMISEQAAEIRVLKADAIEQVEIMVDTDEVAYYDVKWKLIDGVVKHYEVPFYIKTTGTAWRLKEGVRFDEDNGRFYKKQIPTDAEAEIAAETGFSYELPAWLATRLNQ